MVTEPGFSSPNQLDKKRTTAHCAISAPDSRSDALCAAIVGNRGKPSGESRFKLATVWIYKEHWTQAGVVEELFERFDAMLQDNGLPKSTAVFWKPTPPISPGRAPAFRAGAEPAMTGTRHE